MRRFRSLLGASLAPLLVLTLLGSGLPAQSLDLPIRVEARMTPPADVPFGPGEHLRYDVRLGALGKRGEGYMRVLGLDSVRGATTYHVAFAIEGGLLFARVNDSYQSWFDITNLVTRRFIQDVDELNYERYRHWEIFPEEMRFERADNGNSGDIPTDMPLDDVSFFYFIRTLPLEVGDKYTFNRYFRENGNPVIIEVLRRDTVTVPAGTFETVVVRPIIQTKGLFSQGGEAELHFSNDERRILVQMKSKVPLIGSLSLHLREVTDGTPLRIPGGESPSEDGQEQPLERPWRPPGEGPLIPGS